MSQPLPRRPLSQAPAAVSIPGFSRVLFAGLTALLCTELTQCDTPQSVCFSFSTKICNHARQSGSNLPSPSTEIWVQLVGTTASQRLPGPRGQCRLRDGSQQPALILGPGISFSSLQRRGQEHPRQFPACRARGGCGAATGTRHHNTEGQKAMGHRAGALWQLWPSLVALGRGTQHRLGQSCVRVWLPTG